MQVQSHANPQNPSQFARRPRRILHLASVISIAQDPYQEDQVRYSRRGLYFFWVPAPQLVQLEPVQPLPPQYGQALPSASTGTLTVVEADILKLFRCLLFVLCLSVLSCLWDLSRGSRIASKVAKTCAFRWNFPKWGCLFLVVEKSKNQLKFLIVEEDWICSWFVLRFGVDVVRGCISMEEGRRWGYLCS